MAPYKVSYLIRSETLIYVSPSRIPSEEANAIHVVCQAVALAAIYSHVILVFSSDYDRVATDDFDIYGVEIPENLTLRFVKCGFAKELRIAIYGLWLVLLRDNVEFKSSKIYSRNLFFSFFLSIFKCEIAHEFHTFYSKGLRNIMTLSILKNPNARRVAISSTLGNALEDLVGGGVCILNDASRISQNTGAIALSSYDDKRFATGMETLRKIIKPKVILLGTFDIDRGSDIFAQLAERNPEALFIQCGKLSDAHSAKLSVFPNVLQFGFVQPRFVAEILSYCDIGLAPYHSSVKVGDSNQSDTAPWMSPLKIPEYLSAGLRVIVSDLEVLREQHYNHLVRFVSNDIEAWSAALQELIGVIAEAEGQKETVVSYTWRDRAQAISRLVSN